MIIIDVKPTDDLQSMVTKATQNGGGILNLDPVATYLMSGDWYLEDNITIEGNGSTIDFQGEDFGIKIIGSDEYTTGTIAVNYGATAVTGTGTTWDELMVGQSMLIGDYWYEIESVESTTALTLAWDYIGLNVTGETYVIATPVSTVKINNINLQNSAGTLVEFQYVDALEINDTYLYDAALGFSGDDSANFAFQVCTVDSCTAGFTLNNVSYCVLHNFGLLNILNGIGADITKMNNSAISVHSLQNINGVGMKFTDCSNDGMVNYSIIKTASHGIEFVSGNSDFSVESGYNDSCGGDGIKITTSSDRIGLGTTSILNCTGYGINIANANCRKTTLSGIHTSNNTAGAISDSGTGTLKSTTVNNL